ncbi:MAG: hypothetical protein MMC33_005849 [Icmadophila ericetorum]|nr:hypothetical protein [Icmadophila ericetorum]
MENVNVSELVERLGSDEDAVRKMAVFKLQSNIGDPSFADVFISSGGLTKLRYLTLHTTGNTLAYSLSSFSRLLEVDKGWEYVNQDLVNRVVELVVTHPLVNILRGAMSILAAIVSHPHTSVSKTTQPDAFGFRALRPAISAYPQFLEMLVSRLSSADHALCTNALQLINSLMRDAVSNDSDSEWPKFIKKLQELGVIKAVYGLIRSAALQDLAMPLLDFQSLTKVLLKKWRDIPVDLEKPDHRRALKGIHLASNPGKAEKPEDASSTGKKGHNPEKWRRLGFETESPCRDFEEVGFLGMMDLVDYVRKNEDGYQKLLLEQSTQPMQQRCPLARASLAMTAALYEHFEIDKSELEDAKNYFALDARTNIDKAFRPMLLQWSRLHTAAFQAFLRLWKSTGAKQEDFLKVVELVRILLEAVVGAAPRTSDITAVEDELEDYDYQRLRELQMELLELTYEDTWGHHLRQVRDELNHEALQFIKEQRIRCLLQGAWFPNTASSKTENGTTAKAEKPSSYRFIRLSHNRRYLHYADFPTQGTHEPGLDELPDKIDLSIVSSVVSNISATTTTSPSSSTETLRTLPHQTVNASTTKITIHGYLPDPYNTKSEPTPNHTRNNSVKSDHHRRDREHRKESVLLTLQPPTSILASEFLDGLLMLLNQQPITSETQKLIRLVSDYGLKIRLLNVRFDDVLGEENGIGEVPSRDGLDEDYFYDVFGGA